MGSQIDIYFQIYVLIKIQLEDNIQNRFEVEQKFREVIILIREIGDENQRGLYSYKYHTTYCNYLKAISDMENGNRQERLARRYKRHTTTFTEEIQYILYIDIVVSELKQIRQILENELVEISVVDKLVKVEINKRKKCARVLSSCFHQDRTRIPKCPFVFQEIYKCQGDEPFKLISEFKVFLFNKLQKALGLEDHEKRGNELWMITIDYHNASERQWNKLKVLKKDNIKEFPPELFMLMGELAYHQYRSAGNALMLRSKNYVKPKKIINKVNAENKGKEKNEGVSFKSNADIKLESDFNNSVTLIRTIDHEIFFIGEIRCTMNEELVIRENLNKLMDKALNAYNDNKYQEFISLLFEEYGVKNLKRLLNYRDEIGIINIYRINCFVTSLSLLNLEIIWTLPLIASILIILYISVN
ncbi:9486_t:CDS:2 [Gigaspora margarita]|uniref:9486_t:CDS:1 n=1 Tax=Gigaspora margarita TaxID=4874 RepID=A0ABN7VC84_GIGMA|nr:9486_t:CDS:2 [Gigaspora margarita]